METRSAASHLMAGAGPEQAAKYESARLKMILLKKKKVIQWAAAHFRQTNSSLGASVFSKSSAYGDACNRLEKKSTCFCLLASQKQTWI